MARNYNLSFAAIIIAGIMITGKLSALKEAEIGDLDSWERIETWSRGFSVEQARLLYGEVISDFDLNYIKIGN